MKIVCSKSNLVKGVSIVSKAVPSKTTMTSVDASIRIHSRIGIVVLEGTALDTVLTPFARLALLQTIFMCITPFEKMVGKNAIYKYMISVVLVVGDVDMWKTTAIP